MTARQPIETAPKNENRLLLWEDGRIFIGRWLNEKYTLAECRDSGWYSDYGKRVWPSHWQELPTGEETEAPCPDCNRLHVLIAALQAEVKALETALTNSRRSLDASGRQLKKAKAARKEAESAAGCKEGLSNDHNDT